jgi:hypothetical protein
MFQHSKQFYRFYAAYTCINTTKTQPFSNATCKRLLTRCDLVPKYVPQLKAESRKDAENSLAAVLCQARSIAVAQNLNKDKNNRPLDCNVHNIDLSSIKLIPKVERVRAVVEKNLKTPSNHTSCSSGFRMQLPHRTIITPCSVR